MAAVDADLAGTDIFIAAAAVSDYRPVQVARREDQEDQRLAGAARCRARRTSWRRWPPARPRPFVVGFAAETQNVERNALAKLEGKKLDMIAANQVGDGLAFDCDDNALTVYWPATASANCRARRKARARGAS